MCFSINVGVQKFEILGVTLLVFFALIYDHHSMG